MENEKLSLNIITMYYSMMGVNLENVNVKEIYNTFTYLSEISPLESKSLIVPKDDLALELDLDIIFFLQRIIGTEIHLDTKYSYIFEKDYIKSAIGILSIISKIRLIQKDSNNYILEFQRLSYLLHISFSEINTKTIFLLRDLSKLIEEKNIIELSKYINMCPNLTLLLLLAMKMDDESYKVFYEDDSYKINFAKVMQLLEKNYEVSPIFKVSSETYKRMSYEKALKLTRTF